MNWVQILSVILSLPEFNLHLIGAFTWLTTPGPYKVTTCREREFNLDHILTFLTTQGHGGPLRMRDQLNAGATSETTRTWKTIYTIHTLYDIHTFILTSWIWKDDYDGQMIFGEPVDLKFPDMSYMWRKTSPRKLVPNEDRTLGRSATGAHVTACSAAVDNYCHINYQNLNFNNVYIKR